MQPIKILQNWLEPKPSRSRGLYTLSDFKGLFPNLSTSTLKTLLSRASTAGILLKVCRGIYLHKNATLDGMLLFHVANLLRADKFNYISLETVLSDVGIISQIPMNWISIMSSGRSNIINCGSYGSIEFIHTAQRPTEIMDELIFDDKCNMWRASVKLALRDMRFTKRNLDLIDESILNEFI